MTLCLNELVTDPLFCIHVFFFFGMLKVENVNLNFFWKIIKWNTMSLLHLSSNLLLTSYAFYFNKFVQLTLLEFQWIMLILSVLLDKGLLPSYFQQHMLAWFWAFMFQAGSLKRQEAIPRYQVPIMLPTLKL